MAQNTRNSAFGGGKWRTSQATAPLFGIKRGHPKGLGPSQRSEGHSKGLRAIPKVLGPSWEEPPCTNYWFLQQDMRVGIPDPAGPGGPGEVVS